MAPGYELTIGLSIEAGCAVPEVGALLVGAGVPEAAAGEPCLRMPTARAATPHVSVMQLYVLMRPMLRLHAARVEALEPLKAHSRRLAAD